MASHSQNLDVEPGTKRQKTNERTDQDPPLSPPPLPRCGLADRELFYRLMNLDDNIDDLQYIQKARAYVKEYTDWAGEYLRCDTIPELHKPFTYDDKVFKQRMIDVYKQIATDSQEKTDKLGSPDITEYIDNIIQNTPFNITDGCWVRGISMRTAFVTEDIMKIFKIQMDELGDGNFDWNHSNLWVALCNSAGYFPKHPTDHEFAYAKEYNSFAFVAPNYELCISLLSKTFYPEILGFTLSLEWSQVALMYDAAMCKKLGVDPVYFTMHLTVDNAATGHGRLGYEAIQLYMKSLPQSEKASHWERIWRSYIIFQKTNDLTAIISTDKPATKPAPYQPPDPAPEPPLKDQMISMIRGKASKAKYNHQDKALLDANGNPKLLNDFFKDAESSDEKAAELVDALAKSTFVNPEKPLESRIFALMQFSYPARMYGVFSDEEALLWYKWICSLQPAPPPPSPTRKPLPEQMRAALAQILPQAKLCSAHAGIKIGKGPTVLALLEEGPDEFMAALAADKDGQRLFKDSVSASGTGMATYWGATIQDVGRKGVDIAEEWLQQGCPLVSNAATAHAFASTSPSPDILYGVPTGAPAFSDQESELFYRMINIEDNLSDMTWLKKSHAYVSSWMTWAETFAPRSTSTLDHPFAYSENELDNRMDAIYCKLVESAEQQLATVRDGTCPDLPDTVYWLKQQTPFTLLEGCWLRGTPMATGPVKRDQVLLYKILQDELGDGHIAQNHSLLFRTTVQEAGFIPGDPHEEDFCKAYLFEASSSPLYQLCCSQFSTKYYPEILGMTLWLEWSTVTFMYQAALMEHHHINPTYYSMHQSIDNAATGHGRKGVDAVKHYLARVEDKEATWTRIWNSFICFKYQDFILQSKITSQLQEARETSLQDQMLDMIQRKAPYARYNHQKISLGGVELNQWFAKAMENRTHAKELLAKIQESPFVNSGSPLDSGIFSLMKFNSRMYGVFEEDEQLLWLRWITSLKPQNASPNLLSHHKLPRAALAAAKATSDDASMKRALEYLKLTDCPANGTLASFVNENPDTIMAALSDQASLREEFLRAVHGLGPCASAWDQVVPGLGQKGSTIASNWCAEKASESRLSRLGFWLPNDNGLSKFVAQLRQSLPKDVPRQDSVNVLREEIQRDPILKLLITRMVEEAKTVRPTEACAESVPELLTFLDHLVTKAPVFNTSGLVGCPINAILDTSMATRHGYSLFRYPPFNQCMKQILIAWGRFLQSGQSIDTLGNEEGGWFSAEALRAWNINDFVIPKDGFQSWNDFFTRHLAENARPIYPDADIVVSAADATKFSLQKNVQLDGEFWIKSEPYALRYLFGPNLGRRYAMQFENGDVYQAFLDAYSYHRWHAPFGGKVLEMKKVEGLYYSEAEAIGVDFSGPDRSQGYIAHCAARGVILIEAPDPVGLYAMIPVGMAEISGIVWADDVVVNSKVKKGQELGHFSFGGSTYCLVFRKGVIAEWFDHGKIKMGERLARVAKSED